MPAAPRPLAAAPRLPRRSPVAAHAPGTARRRWLLGRTPAARRWARAPAAPQRWRPATWPSLCTVPRVRAGCRAQGLTTACMQERECVLQPLPRLCPPCTRRCPAPHTRTTTSAKVRHCCRRSLPRLHRRRPQAPQGRERPKTQTRHGSSAPSSMSRCGSGRPAGATRDVRVGGSSPRHSVQAALQPTCASPSPQHSADSRAGTGCGSCSRQWAATALPRLHVRSWGRQQGRLLPPLPPLLPPPPSELL